MAFFLPEELLAAVSDARPRGGWYERTGKCKKGNKCTFLHLRQHADGNNDAQLPFVSCTLTAEGDPRMTVRPPLYPMWQKFFKDKGMEPSESPLQRGEQHGELIMYPLHKMLPRMR